MSRISILALAVLCAALAPAPFGVLAAGAKEPDAPTPRPIEKREPARIGVFESAPVIDGKLDDVWKNAVVLKDFYQVQPGDNTAPSNPTEVLIGHDAKHLYIAFHCYDDPTKVRATIPKRDNIFDDDYVGVYLDTFNDRRRAYVIFFNPLGVQADGIFTEDRGEDYSLDIVMESKGAVGPDGWVVEVAIPFKSLRYESGEGKFWGVQFFRRTKRGSNELDSWMPIQRNRSGTLVQEGRLTGFEGISTERTLELIPSLTLSESGKRIAGPPADNSLVDTSRILNKPLGFDPGLSLKYTLTPTITLDATINPDFAQVESDQLVVTANQRFPIFFDEKRPFFLEGIDIFQTTMNVVNTRQIVDPDYAVKLTGKRGRDTFGILLASDNAPGNFSDEERGDPNVLPSIEKFLDKNAYIGILRVKHDVGNESNLGFFATSYNFIEEHNQLAGFDGRFRINPKTLFSFQTVGTATRSHFYDPDLNENLYRNGNAFGYFWQLDYTDRNFGYQLNSVGRTRDYRADVGFTRRVNTNRNDLFLRYSTDPKSNSTFINYRIFTVGGTNYDWNGRMQNWDDESQVQLNFKRQTFLSLGYVAGYERLFEGEFGPNRSALNPVGGFFGNDPERSTHKNQVYVVGGSTLSKQFNFFIFAGYTRGEFDFDFGGGPKFPRVSPAAIQDPNAPLDPGPGNSLFIDSNFTFQPTDALRTSLSFTKSKLRRQDTNLVAFDDNIFSWRTTYQFSRFTFARVRVDYDSLSSRVQGQYLVGWTPNPGTSFYIGYNDESNYNGFSPFTGLREPGLHLSNRTFFIKMSYLIRHSS